MMPTGNTMAPPLLSFLLILAAVASVATYQPQHQPQQKASFARRSFLTKAGSAAAALVSGASSALLVPPQPATAAYIDPNQSLPAITKRVYLDVQIGDEKPGRIVIGLFGEIMPRTVDNFATLASEGKYAGTNFYRVISGMSLQGGAIGDPVRGRSGKSAFADGAPFEPDNYNILHSKAGLVSTVRGVGGLADSRFFIQTVDDGGWADAGDRYAVFGLVEEGLPIVQTIEGVDVQPPSNGPKNPVKIISSGSL